MIIPKNLFFEWSHRGYTYITYIDDDDGFWWWESGRKDFKYFIHNINTYPFFQNDIKVVARIKLHINI
jgi:hypothetical protein